MPLKTVSAKRRYKSRNQSEHRLQSGLVTTYKRWTGRSRLLLRCFRAFNGVCYRNHEIRELLGDTQLRFFFKNRTALS